MMGIRVNKTASEEVRSETSVVKGVKKEESNDVKVKLEVDSEDKFPFEVSRSFSGADGWKANLDCPTECHIVSPPAWFGYGTQAYRTGGRRDG